MQIIINGQASPLDKAITVEELLHRLGYLDHFVAVAVNQDCVLRKNYGTHLIKAEDQIEILAPMAGG